MIKNFSILICCQTISGKTTLFNPKFLAVLLQYRLHIGFHIVIDSCQIQLSSTLRPVQKKQIIILKK